MSIFVLLNRKLNSFIQIRIHESITWNDSTAWSLSSLQGTGKARPGHCFSKAIKPGSSSGCPIYSIQPKETLRLSYIPSIQVRTMQTYLSYQGTPKSSIRLCTEKRSITNSSVIKVRSRMLILVQEVAPLVWRFKITCLMEPNPVLYLTHIESFNLQLLQLPNEL